MRTRMICGTAAAGMLIAGLAALPAMAAAASPQPDEAGRTPVPGLTAAQAVSPDFTCPGGAICLFPKDDYTGNYNGSPAEIEVDGVENGAWFSFGGYGAGSPNPGSMDNNTGSSVWVYDHQEPVKSGSNPTCLRPGRHVLDNKFGHFEVFPGPDCSHAYTRPLP